MIMVKNRFNITKLIKDITAIIIKEMAGCDHNLSGADLLSAIISINICLLGQGVAVFLFGFVDLHICGKMSGQV